MESLTQWLIQKRYVILASICVGITIFVLYFIEHKIYGEVIHTGHYWFVGLVPILLIVYYTIFYYQYDNGDGEHEAVKPSLPLFMTTSFWQLAPRDFKYNPINDFDGSFNNKKSKANIRARGILGLLVISLLIISSLIVYLKDPYILTGLTLVSLFGTILIPILFRVLKPTVNIPHFFAKIVMISMLIILIANISSLAILKPYSLKKANHMLNENGFNSVEYVGFIENKLFESKDNLILNANKETWQNLYVYFDKLSDKEKTLDYYVFEATKDNELCYIYISAINGKIIALVDQSGNIIV